jgi:hypothetical protein
LVNQVVAGDVDASQVDAKGILGRIGAFFVNVNRWLGENAGIDFFGILKGIGHFFLIVIEFVVDLIKKVL